MCRSWPTRVSIRPPELRVERYRSTSALGAELLMAATGIDLVHIPYKGTAPAIAELVAAHIDLMFADLSQLLPHARTGTLRLTAAAGDTRSPAMPTSPRSPSRASQG